MIKKLRQSKVFLCLSAPWRILIFKAMIGSVEPSPARRVESSEPFDLMTYTSCNQILAYAKGRAVQLYSTRCLPIRLLPITDHIDSQNATNEARWLFMYQIPILRIQDLCQIVIKVFYKYNQWITDWIALMSSMGMTKNVKEDVLKCQLNRS